MEAKTGNALYAHIDFFVNSLKFMTYNVDQAVREEKFENTKWINRMNRVKSLINEVDADIVCLQEMRKLPNSPSVNSWLGGFDKYYFEIGFRNASTLSFGQAILYKPDRFYAARTIKRWLSDTPAKISDTWAADSSKGFGYLVLLTQFLPVVNEKVVQNAQAFWIVNVHFGLDEEIKTKSCHKLIEIVKDVCKDETVIISGDFNFFPDKDGDKQRAILAEHFTDIGKDAKTLGGKQIEGTFIGYEHDEFKSDLTNMKSRLDHIFGSKRILELSDPVLYTKTMLEQEPEELTTRDYPSDHLPIVANLTLY